MTDQNTCGALIKQIHDELEKNANNAMRAHDITMAQCGALLILNGASEKQMTLKERDGWQADQDDSYYAAGSRMLPMRRAGHGAG